MIIQNGYIEAKIKSAGDIDPVTGYPVKSYDESYASAIPCQYIANQYNQLGRSRGGSFTIAQYQILIEQQREPFTAEQIRLTDMSGEIIGDFSVIAVEPIEAVCELKITV